MSFITRGVGWLHQRLIKPRQSDRLAEIISNLLPEHGRVLDVGCGTGKIARQIAERKAGLDVRGIDILVQPKAEVEVCQFDGKKIPFADQSFDAVLLVDVLHHTSNQAELLAEALRVSRACVIVKDHICTGRLSFMILSFMDWVGNRPLGIDSPRKYLSKNDWSQLFAAIGARRVNVVKPAGIYSFPFSLLFESGKQVVFQLSGKPLA